MTAAQRAELNVVLQQLTGAVGDSTLIDLPSPLGRSLRTFIESLTRSEAILIKRSSSLFASNLYANSEHTFDRLQSLAVNHVAIDSTNPDGLAICAEYTTAALARAVGRGLFTKSQSDWGSCEQQELDTVMFGIMHVSSVFSRAPASSQVLTGVESDVDVDMKAFILVNLMMYHIVCGQYNAALALHMWVSMECLAALFFGFFSSPLNIHDDCQ